MMPRSRQSRWGVQASTCSPGSRGFSLLELLVVLVITTLLTAIMFPGMRTARESAYRLMCASNMRQISTGIVLYSSDRLGRIPHSELADQGFRLDQMKLTCQEENPEDPNAPGRLKLDGLGVLVGGGTWGAYCDSPACLYCPSHTNIHTYERYRNNLEESRYRLNPTGIAIGNYHYDGYRPGSDRIATLTDDRLIMTDGFSTKADFNHEVGMNKLYGDGSIEWWADVTTEFFNNLPTNPLMDPNEQRDLFSILKGIDKSLTDRSVGYE